MVSEQLGTVEKISGCEEKKPGVWSVSNLVLNPSFITYWLHDRDHVTLPLSPSIHVCKMGTRCPPPRGVIRMKLGKWQTPDTVRAHHRFLVSISSPFPGQRRVSTRSLF